MRRDQILAKVIEDPNGCWIPQVPLSAEGYAVTGGDSWHRRAYKAFIGPIPEGHDLDHERNCPTACCNPWHLTPVTKTQHNWLTYVRRVGQMPRQRLRTATQLHNQVVPPRPRNRGYRDKRSRSVR